jgi:hypothetical protein
LFVVGSFIIEMSGADETNANSEEVDLASQEYESSHHYDVPEGYHHDDGEDEANLAAIDEELGDDDHPEIDESDIIDEEMEKQMEELMVDNADISSIPTGEIPAGALPTDKGGRLSSHAAEFWFPECRNCTCCKGYKHGCVCVKTRRFVSCQHESCTVETAHRGQKLTESTSPRNSNGNNPNSRRSVSDGSASNSSICRFEQSPSGCRFGSNCRYRHVGQQGGDAGDEYFGRSNSGGYNSGSQRSVSGGSNNNQYGQYYTSNQPYGDNYQPGSNYWGGYSAPNYGGMQQQQQSYPSPSQQYPQQNFPSQSYFGPGMNSRDPNSYSQQTNHGSYQGNNNRRHNV